MSLRKVWIIFFLTIIYYWLNSILECTPKPWITAILAGQAWIYIKYKTVKKTTWNYAIFNPKITSEITDNKEMKSIYSHYRLYLEGTWDFSSKNDSKLDNVLAFLLNFFHFRHGLKWLFFFSLYLTLKNKKTKPKRYWVHSYKKQCGKMPDHKSWTMLFSLSLFLKSGRRSH